MPDPGFERLQIDLERSHDGAERTDRRAHPAAHPLRTGVEAAADSQRADDRHFAARHTIRVLGEGLAGHDDRGKHTDTRKLNASRKHGYLLVLDGGGMDGRARGYWTVLTNTDTEKVRERWVAVPVNVFTSRVLNDTPTFRFR